MKQLLHLILVLIVCLLVVTSGCTGIPGVPEAAPSGSSPDTVADPAGRAGSTWSGTFLTTWQGGGHDIRMVLVQSGDSVTGTYDFNNGTIIGTVEGNQLIGTWTEDNGESIGTFMFELAQDGKTFAGFWDYEGDDFIGPKEGTGQWTGIRVS